MMSRNEIEQIVNQFLIDELEIDEELVKGESLLKEDLRIDSLDYVDIAVLVDEKFGFKMRVEDVRGMRCLSQFYDYVEQKMKN